MPISAYEKERREEGTMTRTENRLELSLASHHLPPRPFFLSSYKKRDVEEYRRSCKCMLDSCGLGEGT